MKVQSTFYFVQFEGNDSAFEELKLNKKPMDFMQIRATLVSVKEGGGVLQKVQK